MADGRQRNSRIPQQCTQLREAKVTRSSPDRLREQIGAALSRAGQTRCALHDGDEAIRAPPRKKWRLARTLPGTRAHGMKYDWQLLYVAAMHTLPQTRFFVLGEARLL